MQVTGSSLRALTVLGAGVLFSASALAQKDIPYPSGATATVSGQSVTMSPTAFSVGAAGSATLSEALYPGQQVVVSATWSIQDRFGSGQNTSYDPGRSITFASSTTATPGPAVAVAAIPDCTVTSKSSTCVRSITFDAPTTPGSYQITVTLAGTGFNGATGLTQPSGGSVLRVNFSVAEPVAVLLDTKLTVARKCVLLNAGDVTLEAKLEELVSGDAVAGASIDFFVNPPSSSVGTGVTDTDGQASVVYNVNSLPVGDHNLFAQYAGSSGYNPSDDSNLLGVSYLFGGFQQPINADGTSVFGHGRVIPVKIRLADANGTPVADATPHVYLTQYSSTTGLGEVLEPATSVSAADTGNVMRYDPEAGQYIYNWDLSARANGTYAVVVDLGDSAACNQGPYHAVITVAKKQK
jgi:hypothetical protein